MRLEDSRRDGEVDGDSGTHRRSNPRSIDSFLEEAYTASSSSAASFSSSRGPISHRHLTFWITVLSLGVANSSDASEILCISYVLSDPTFDKSILQNDVGWKGGLLAGSVFFGMLLGGLFVGALGDALGRRPTLLFGLIANAIAGTSSALSLDVWTLSLTRFIAGIGIGATVPPLFALAAELSPPRERGLCVTVVASFWMVGSIYVASIALLCFEVWGVGWRVFAVCCAAPSGMGAMLVWRNVPESPRFLAMKGEYSGAVEIANDLGFKRLGYRGRELSIEEVRRQYPRPTVGSWGGDDANDTTWTTIIKSSASEFLRSTSKLYSPHLLRTTIPLQIMWTSLCFGSYGLMTWINSLFVAIHLRNVYVNALLFAFANLPGNILSALLMDRVGRKKMLSSSMLLAALSLIGFAFYADKGEHSSNINAAGVVWSACLFQAFTIMGWNSIDTITSELFPTSVRSTGMGTCTACGRVGAMVAQFVNGSLVEEPVALLLVAAGSLAVGAVTPLVLGGEDMAGKGLEDSVAVVDRSTDGGLDEDKVVGDGGGAAHLMGNDDDSGAGNALSDCSPMGLYSSLESSDSESNAPRRRSDVLLV